MLTNPPNQRKRYFYYEANFAVFHSKLLEHSGNMLQNFFLYVCRRSGVETCFTLGPILGAIFLKYQNLIKIWVQPAQALFLLRNQYYGFSLEIARTYWK